MSIWLRNSPYCPHERRSWRNVQNPKDLLPFGRNKKPLWWPMNYALQAQVTLDNAIAPTGKFVLLKLLATSTQAKGFRTQSRQVVDQNGNGFNFSKVGIEQDNVFGISGPGQVQPAYLPIPYPVPELLSLMNRTANKALTSDPSSGLNNIQLCFFGFRDDITPGPSDFEPV